MPNCRVWTPPRTAARATGMGTGPLPNRSYRPGMPCSFAYFAKPQPRSGGTDFFDWHNFRHSWCVYPSTTDSGAPAGFTAQCASLRALTALRSVLVTRLGLSLDTPVLLCSTPVWMWKGRNMSSTDVDVSQPAVTRADEPRADSAQVNTDAMQVDKITTWGATRSQLEALIAGMVEGLLSVIMPPATSCTSTRPLEDCWVCPQARAVAVSSGTPNTSR
ncbi:hypothetical protein BH24DEI2_BH24DEI2_09700 [soil metagenome]